MKKTVRNILILGLFFFMYNIGNVGAEKVCTYKASSDIGAGFPNNVVCKISNAGSIECSYTPDGANYELQLGDILNWNKEAPSYAKAFIYDDNCPQNLVYISDGATMLRVVAIDNIIDAKEMFEWNLPNVKTIILNNFSTVEQKLGEIKEKINKMKPNYGQCLNGPKEDNRRKIEEGCFPAINNIFTYIDAYEKELLQMKNNGQLDGYENLTNEIFSLIDETRKYFNDEKAKLEFALENGMNNVGIWNVYTGNYVKPPEEPTNPSDDNKCVLFGSNVDPIVSWIVKLIYIFIPVFIIIASIIDFVGVTLSGEDKNFKKAGTKLIKRLIVGAIVIFLPILIVFIVDLSGVLVPYEIDSNTIFCSIF